VYDDLLRAQKEGEEDISLVINFVDLSVCYSTIVCILCSSSLLSFDTYAQLQSLIR
jgi:hypothetical protein